MTPNAPTPGSRDWAEIYIKPDWGLATTAVVFDHYPPSSYVEWMLPKRLNGTGDASIRCMKATFDFFKFELLPKPEILTPGSPTYNGGKIRLSRLTSKVSRGCFRIAYEGWPGHERAKMARVQIQSDWIDETYAVIHNHLIIQKVPYLYLCNKHGNALGPNWQAHTGVLA